MWSVRKKLAEVYRALDVAETYPTWLAAAFEHDELTGAAAWRVDDDSPFFDAAALRKASAHWRRLREKDDGPGLAGALTDELYRHLNDLAVPGLYTHALSGTKHVIGQFLDEAEASLRWLAVTEFPGIPAAAKRQQFGRAYKVFGHSALLLSGGATLGFHHLGVVKALFEHGLLPHILSGSSTGAMIASGVCARNDTELADMYARPEQIRLDGLLPVGPRTAAGARALLDPNQLYDVLRHNVGGEVTFAEAHAHSGRTLNISVSPVRSRQKPRLLNHLTSPDVLVARAALASSALPGLFPPVVLEQRHPGGDVIPYHGGEKWVDGSLFGDLPKRRLARLHNVNHFIVSQTNPHVLPFLRHHGQRGITPAVSGLLSASIRTQGAFAVDVMRRLNPSGPLKQVSQGAYQLVQQDYRGDIDIHPQFHWRLYSKVVSNPTPADLAAFIREGERSVWPKLQMISDQTRIGRVFRECMGLLA
jgi:TAG lipase / steryl ester hydrolase / phospholipase A2 / LPA acyltransferase